MDTPNENRGKANLVLTGSICLTDIPKELIKVVETKQFDPSTGKPIIKKYLNLAVMELSEPSNFGDTHFISCAPKKEERIEGRNYIIGNFKKWIPKIERPSQEDINAARTMTPEEIAAAEAAGEGSDLPF